MKGILWVAAALLVILPTATATSHVPPVTGVRVEEGNQVLRITWDAVDGASGYVVRVYEGDAVVQTLNRTTTEATFRGVNGRTYDVTVSATAADGSTGPESARVSATPAFAQDRLFLAAGLLVVAAGLAGHYAWLLGLGRRMRRKASSSGGLPQRDER